jgi:hypothetical protein
LSLSVKGRKLNYPICFNLISKTLLKTTRESSIELLRQHRIVQETHQVLVRMRNQIIEEPHLKMSLRKAGSLPLKTQNLTLRYNLLKSSLNNWGLVTITNNFFRIHSKWISNSSRHLKILSMSFKQLKRNIECELFLGEEIIVTVSLYL